MADIQVVVFQVGGERYGVEVGQVQSIERMTSITRVPRTLPFIRGVMNLRGVVVPVIDLRERFGLETVESTEETRIIIVNVDEMTVGLIVDSVLDVQMIDEALIEPAPSMIGGLEATYLHGIAKVGDTVLILLNLTKVLSRVEEEQLRETELYVQG
jgi:purine-binding chemotaxis protein CheW